MRMTRKTTMFERLFLVLTFHAKQRLLVTFDEISSVSKISSITRKNPRYAGICILVDILLITCYSQAI